MSTASLAEQEPTAETELRRAVSLIAAGAQELDRSPRFPREAFDLLRKAGALSFTAPADGVPPSRSLEWAAVRAVAAADASVGRIFDGHLNAVERIAFAAPEEIRDSELSAVRDGRRLLGVWGADPGPGEGSPAVVHAAGEGLVLDGVKTFCSGATGIDGALVTARTDPPGPPALVLVDLDRSVQIDREWFRASGLRASESARVIFDSTPIRAVLGEPGELGRDPWFSGDAIRTAASWAGMADAAAAAALGELRERRSQEELAQLAAARISAARGSIDRWMEAAGARADFNAPVGLHRFSVELRAEIAGAGARILDEAARACGSHPFATGADLDRARRDLQLFVLQHRLDPLMARQGADLLKGPPR